MDIKKDRIAMLILDKLDFKTKTVTRDEGFPKQTKTEGIHHH